MSPKPVRIVPAAAVQPRPLPSPVDYIAPPYAIAVALTVDRGVPIRSPDADEGARRSLLVTEGVQFGIVEVGPRGGERWHRHLSYYDILIYVERGRGEIGWTDDAGEHRAPIGAGDFIHIAPGAQNCWVNTGAEVLRFLWVGYYHTPTERTDGAPEADGAAAE
ncbi:MAG: cupin domain-containing protein [Chloroflexota bacterium]|nr:cupin domain-containing protein [Dehalococcoidia bacterium]MDW8253717.1 cupin domain-containing protein [Chloroflexota bacterium]